MSKVTEVDAELAEWKARAVAVIDEQLGRLYPATPAASCVPAWIPATAQVRCVSPDTAGLVADRLHKAMVPPVRHLIEAGGRRWRAALLMEVIGLLGGDTERWGPLVAAAELLHTASLIVDDVEDSSALRRGLPAAHTVFGVPSALNAATTAYFAPDRAIRLACPDDPALGGALRDIYLAAIRAAHAGQALDIQGHQAEMDRAVRTGQAGTVLDLVRITHRLKSGTAVAACMEMAAVVTGADPRLRQALTAFGEALATAYQINDDVADLRGVTRNGRATKQANEDLRAGKVTMPLAHSVALLPPLRLQHIWRQVRDGCDGPSAAAVARELLACGAADACEREAQALVAEAAAELEPLLPARTVLFDLARQLIRVDHID